MSRFGRPSARRVGESKTDSEEAKRILAMVSSVEWPGLEHAYGPAGDVRDRLTAVTVGDQATRETAWSDLWGNIHQQGTVYSATAPAVPILQALAAWPEFPDRVEAIAFLIEIGRAAHVGPMPGSHAGVYIRDHATLDGRGLDREAAESLASNLRVSIGDATDQLMSNWDTETPAIRRSLILLAAVQPDRRSQYDALTESEVPDCHREAWREYHTWPESEEAWNLRDGLEQWGHSGN